MDGELGEGRAATNLTTAILGSRRGGKTSGRRSGALSVVWLGEGVGDEAQELGSGSGHRRDGGGCGNGERRRWACSVERERTRQRRGTRERKRARGSRESGRRRGEDARRRGGQATQAGSLVAWRPRARRRAPLCVPGERKQVAGTGQHSAGPASGLPGGLRQVSGQVVCSFFYFFFVLFVLFNLFCHCFELK